jgi:hypothetical protein
MTQALRSTPITEASTLLRLGPQLRIASVLSALLVLSLCIFPLSVGESIGGSLSDRLASIPSILLFRIKAQITFMPP